MSIETNTGQSGEILFPKDFLARALGVLGVESVSEVSPIDKARILSAFQFERAEDDWTRWLSRLDLPYEQVAEIDDMLVQRGSEMMTLAELLIVGRRTQGTETDGVEAFMTQ